MRLVYLTCALLWLVMSALIGMSFVSRAVFNAEQRFNAFDQQFFEQLGQKLQSNEIVLDSYAAYCAQMSDEQSELAFARRLRYAHPQMAGLFRVDGRSFTLATPALLHKSDGVSQLLTPSFHRLLRTQPPWALRLNGTQLSSPFRLADGSAAYLLMRAVGAPGGGVVALVVRADALLPSLIPPLPVGAGVRLWYPRTATGDGWRLERVSAARSTLEGWLFPQLASQHQLSGSIQPLMVSMTWQLGFSDIDPFACVLALLLSLVLLAIILVGVTSYASFLEGSQERELRLFYLANHDRLTNLANRNLFYDRLHHAISRLNRHDYCLAVLFLDMDRFKPVNDTYGHATGDLVLQMIAARLKVELRTEDTVARLGGDEFVVLLEEVESKLEVNLVVQRLKQAIESPYEVSGHLIRLGVSIGVAYYPEDGVLIEELLSVADRKMYGEKSEPVMAL